MKHRRDLVWLLGFAIAALFLYTSNLGNVPLRDWDEGIVANVSRQMYHATNYDTWLYPKNIGGIPYWNKPPLIHWLVTISYHLFGVSEWSTRLPGAILSACSVPLIYIIGRLIFPQRIPAIFSTVVYLTLIQMVRHGRLGMLDGAIAFWFCITILGTLIARSNTNFKNSYYKSISQSPSLPTVRYPVRPQPARGRTAVSPSILCSKNQGTRYNFLGLWLVGLGLGAACLTKGIALGGLLAVIVVSFWLVTVGKNQLLSQKHLLLLLTIGLSFLPVIVWYGLQYSRYGQEFLGINLGEQTFGRIWHTLGKNQGRPWYYLLIMAKDTLPWLFFLPGGIRLAIKQRDRLWGKLVLVWGGIYFLVISMMATKLPWYIIPVYPAISLIIGANLANIWHRYSNFKVYRDYLLIIVFSCLSIGCGVVGFIYGLSEQADDRDLVLVFLTLAVGLAVTTILLLRRSRYFIITIAVSLYLGLLLFFQTAHWNWELAEQYSVQPVAQMIQNVTPPQQIIYTSYPYSRPSLNFYSDRLIIAKSDDKLEKLWLESPSVYFLLSSDAAARLNLPGKQVVSSFKSWEIVSSEQ